MFLRILFLLVLGLCRQGSAQPFTYFPVNFPFLGSATTPLAMDYAEDKYGRKYVYGRISHEVTFFTTAFNGMIRFNADFTIDTTFRISGISGISGISHVNTFGDSFIIEGDYKIKKIDLNGTDIQPSYFSNMYANHPFLEVFLSTNSAAYSDGRILMTSEFPIINSDSSKLYFLHRFLPDGRRDSTFNISTDNGVIRAKKMDDSSIYVSGYFSTYNGVNRPSFVKVDTSGNMDTSFNMNARFGRVFPLYKYPNGKLLVRGDFLVNGHPNPLIFARLNVDGSLDSSFKRLELDSFSNTWIVTVLPLADGGFLCGGLINIYDGFPVQNILKIDSLGNIDTTAFPGSGLTTNQSVSLVSSIRRISPTKYLVMGQFKTFNGIYSPALVMLQQHPVSVNQIEPNIFSTHPFPNPSSGIFSIDAAVSVEKVVVYNQQGKNVGEFNTNKIDLQQLPDGMYFYKITTTSSQTATGKLVKLSD